MLPKPFTPSRRGCARAPVRANSGRRAAGSLVRLAVLAGLLGVAPLHAAELDRAQALWLQGQRDEALHSIDQALRLNPGDARLRFARAVMLGGLGQLTQAEQALRELTRDHPDLADPFNNLAVIHAQRGELEQARQALEQALRLQPEHALARENLGDVLLRLALRSYEQALAEGSGERPALELKARELRALLARRPAGGASAPAH